MLIAVRLGICRNLISAQQKQGLLIGIIVAAVTALFFIDALPQNTNYHSFADTRSLWGIPNAGDVFSNIGFVIVGLLGLIITIRGNFKGGVPTLRRVYITLFIGILLTAFGSAYYHWSPNNITLVWDRLPMTIAFMALFAMVIGEQLSEELALILFGPLIVFGIFSVAYWHYTEQKGMGDLRIYLLVQFLPILLIPILLLLFKSPFTSSLSIWLAIGFYVLAKVFELQDKEIHQLDIGVSGHSIKHLLAAFGGGSILWGLQTRQFKNQRVT